MHGPANTAEIPATNGGGVCLFILNPQNPISFCFLNKIEFRLVLIKTRLFVQSYSIKFETNINIFPLTAELPKHDVLWPSYPRASQHLSIEGFKKGVLNRAHITAERRQSPGQRCEFYQPGYERRRRQNTARNSDQNPRVRNLRQASETGVSRHHNYDQFMAALEYSYNTVSRVLRV